MSITRASLLAALAGAAAPVYAMPAPMSFYLPPQRHSSRRFVAMDKREARKARNRKRAKR